MWASLSIRAPVSVAVAAPAIVLTHQLTVILPVFSLISLMPPLTVSLLCLQARVNVCSGTSSSCFFRLFIDSRCEFLQLHPVYHPRRASFQVW